MTKTEFLSQLEAALSSMAEPERQAAIQFYADYIDDAQSQRIFQELGDPKNIAKRILGDIPHLEDDDFAIPGESSSKEVPFRQLKITTEFSSVILKRGTTYTVNAKGIVVDDLIQRQEGDQWIIKETNKWRSFLNFLQRTTQEGVKLEITVPPGVDFIEVSSMSGRVELSDLGLKRAIVRTDTGRMTIQRCTIHNLKATTTLGFLSLESCTIEDCMINGQAGTMKVQTSSFTNCDIRSDVAQIEVLKSSVVRAMMLRSTVGPISVQLEQPLSRCQVVVDSTIGNVTINGEKKKVHFVANAETSLHVKQEVGPVTILLD